MAASSQYHDRAARTEDAGRIKWGRFVALFIPALAVVALMMSGIVKGTLPISVAAEGQRRIKIEMREMTATGYGAFPRFFETQDGRKHPVVVVGLSDVHAEGLCGSGAVPTPLGKFVLRVETRPRNHLRADDVQLAIENIDGATLGGQTIALNRADTARDGTPVDAGTPGTLPISARTVLLDLNADVRWVTTSGIRLSGVDLNVGTDVAECF